MMKYDNNFNNKPFYKKEAFLLTSLILVVLFIALAAHWPALSARAITFDDDLYLIDNKLVQNPSWNSAKRFLMEVTKPSTVRGYYQPLNMISLMLDYAIGGRVDNLMPFHRTSLILHLINTALVIVFLYLLFGSVWPAAIAGLLFAVHPMTVEPIPWVGERKTLLSTFFALCCMLIYVRYTRKRNWKLYIICFVTYVLALMSKPTVVMLPLLFLLLDFWPLRRLSKRVIFEKTPLFILAAVFSFITFISQKRASTITMPGEYDTFIDIPLVFCHNIIFYLYKIFWPVNLSSHYLFPKVLNLSNPMILAGVIGTPILILLLIISLRWTRSLLTGWLFFFVAIFPTMQIIGFTKVIASDKFAYFPSVGLLMVLAHFLNKLWKNLSGFSTRRSIIIFFVLVLATLEFVGTRSYLVHWKTTESLYEHMINLCPESFTLYYNYGCYLQAEGKLDHALKCFDEAIKIDSQQSIAYNNRGLAFLYLERYDEAAQDFSKAVIEENNLKAANNLGLALKGQGKIDDAVKIWKKLVEIEPNYSNSHFNLGVALAEKGLYEQAVKHLKATLRLNPDWSAAYNYLAKCYDKLGMYDLAIQTYDEILKFSFDKPMIYYEMATIYHKQGNDELVVEMCKKALQLKPDFLEVRINLARTLFKLKRVDQTIQQYYQIIKLEPDRIDVLDHLARILATTEDAQLQNPDDAVKFAERACEITNFKNPFLLDTLAIAYASSSKYDQAIKTAEKAIKLAESKGDKKLASQIHNRLRLYRSGKPFQGQL